MNRLTRPLSSSVRRSVVLVAVIACVFVASGAVSAAATSSTNTPRTCASRTGRLTFPTRSNHACPAGMRPSDLNTIARPNLKPMNPLQVAQLMYYPVNNTNVGPAPAPIAGSNEPAAMAFDGQNLWVVIGSSPGSDEGGTGVERVNPYTGVVGPAFAIPGADALAWDGSRIWVVSRTANTITPIDVMNGAAMPTMGGPVPLPPPPPGYGPPQPGCDRV